MPKIAYLQCLAVFAFAPVLQAQSTVAKPPQMRTLAQPSTVTSPCKRYSELAAARVKHMARFKGAEVSGDGTRYFSVTDQDLAGAKTQEALLQRLAPESIKRGDGVRRVEVLVDLSQPLKVQVPRTEMVRVGTVLLENPALGAVEVNTQLNISSLTIIGVPHAKP